MLKRLILMTSLLPITSAFHAGKVPKKIPINENTRTVAISFINSLSENELAALGKMLEIAYAQCANNTKGTARNNSEESIMSTMQEMKNLGLIENGEPIESIFKALQEMKNLNLIDKYGAIDNNVANLIVQAANGKDTADILTSDVQDRKQNRDCCVLA